LIQQHFTGAEKTNANNAVISLEVIINPKSRNLTPEERQQYGSINEQNKLLVNKAKDFHDAEPAKSSPDVNWTEFNNDFADRVFLEALALKLESLANRIRETKILHDYDNYQNTLLDYHYTDFKANHSNDAGYETKYNEMKQFFPNAGGSGNSTPQP
jgi:hypothetical protein